jgi:hypothetical protein
MTEEDHTPVYLTRYQLKKSQQHQTNDEKITTPRNKCVSTSKSSSSAKFSRKVEPLEKSSSEPKRRRKVSPGPTAKRRVVVKSKSEEIENSSDSEIKGKRRTRRINLSPDTAKSDKDSSQLLLMPGLEFLFGGLLEEANSRLIKRASNKIIKKGDQIEAKLKGWAETFSGEIHSVNEDKTYDIRFDDGELRRNIKRKEFKLKFNEEDTDEDDSDWGGDIEGKPEEVEYTEEEHSYITKLDKSKQGELMYLEKEILKIKKDEKPIRFKILELDDLSSNSKANIISRIDHFYSLDSADNEYHKLSTWVETLERMPFGKYIDMPVKADSTLFEVGNFLCDTRKILDKAVFGHNEAKDKIITTIAKQISNPSGGGTCIGIQGPPGNGKTTLVKEGICKAMKRPFSMVALGGMQDSSFMMGHEYTYEGSKPGRIIEILGESGCMNPVIYFDELDKISKTQKGEEIENFLCHLTDSSQNSEFHDKYMSGINFDLSKATFIFSYNDPKAVNPILLDRIYKIKTDGFTDKSKLEICKDYLLPNILEECNFTRDDIKFTDSAIKKIIQNYTDSEKGVRNLKRAVETIVAKINVLRYMYPIEPVEQKETVKEELKSEVSLCIDKDESSEKVEVATMLETIIETAVSKVIEVKSTTTTDKDDIGIRLTVSEKIPELTSELNSKLESEDKKLADVKPKEPVKKEFTADKIMESKIKKFSLPYEVNEDNLSKFITSIPYNPSIAHLYL